MRIDEACEATFARHETFQPRLGWFRKAFLASGKDQGGFFLAEDAPVRLGVGKNMVRSIRFWGTAARLISDIDHPTSKRLSYTVPTNLGLGLLGTDGLDPYMEHPATWWWIHWMMLAPRSSLPVWWILLNEMNAVEFDEELANRVCIDTINASSWDAPHESSIQKDVTAFLRTYADGSSARGKFDDHFGSPLRELRLVRRSPSGYRLATGGLRNLPGEIVLAAALDYASLVSSTAKTVSLSRLSTEPGAPGRAFRLSEEQLAESIGPIVEATNALSLSAPAGAAQLGWKGDPARVAHGLLSELFGSQADLPMVAGPEAREARFDLEIELLLIERSRGVVL